MIDAQVATKLSAAGSDALRVSDVGMARADDRQILQHAIQKDRVLVTLDGHFGDWVVLPLSNHPGVVRIKADPATTANVLELLLSFFDKHRDTDLRDTLVIVHHNGIRWIRTG